MIIGKDKKRLEELEVDAIKLKDIAVHNTDSLEKLLYNCDVFRKWIMTLEARIEALENK